MPAAKKWPKPVISEVADVLGIRQDWIVIREEMRSAGVDQKVLWEKSWERFLGTRPDLVEQSEVHREKFTVELRARRNEERARYGWKKGGRDDQGVKVGVKRSKSIPEQKTAEWERLKREGGEPAKDAADEKGSHLSGVMRQYVAAEEFGGLTANGLDEVRWVASNIAVLTPEPGTCPSPVAWGLLFWVRRSAANAEKFWTNIWPKTLPSKSSIGDEGGAAPEADETDLDDLLTELSGELEAADVAAPGMSA